MNLSLNGNRYGIVQLQKSEAKGAINKRNKKYLIKVLFGEFVCKIRRPILT